MAEDEGRLESKVAVPAVSVVVEVRAAEGCVCDVDCSFSWSGWPKRTGFDTEVLWTVAYGS